ncbi:FAD-dependent monooxygenase [Amycolatopsis pithecellobii]|uniref:NAD(P)-binding protein n=1 Tax=Amycolatopsis pithecellobii TaxID=664692 RepID=A0A6N7YQX5_9PSEU|nr:FAD-dependent monooxygenase [Amycolatopsis pithecellobii]MTD55415.1 NAD(P)-binding protein [Amycolatopsis pithecellobii]
MTTTVPLLVVGGGIGGLATALSIARHGRRVHVLERAAEFAEIGAGLQFGPNASRALAALGVYDDIRPLAVAPRRAVMKDAVDGNVLTTLDFGTGFESRYGYPYLVLHRRDLLEALLAKCRACELITLETRRTVVDAEVRADGATVVCSDGATYHTDALVAADGLHSTLRGKVIGDEAVCSGYAAYRGTVPMDHMDGAVAADEVTLWVGPGIHAIQYPVRGGELYNQVVVFRSKRFHNGHTEPGEWGTPDELDDAFADACGAVRAAVSRIGRERHWPMYDRIPTDTWINGRLLLTGDAAHPMLQYLGQGACQALEDAVELGYRLAHNGSDIDTAYRDFETVRLPRTAQCQTRARPWGDMWHTDDPLTVGLRNRFLAMRAPDDYSELDWLYAAAPPGAAAAFQMPRAGSVRG